ncbi:MAG: chitin disaccharide deacetylase [Ginsengibacter sp.]
MGVKKLIVNADDFGQSEGINCGIIKTYEQGIVTSASLMVRYPAAISASEYLKKNIKLGCGIHFDLGEWIFLENKWQTLYEIVSLDDVELVTKEINKQLETFCDLVGRKPTHIDSHQHVHLKDAILPIFIKIAKKLNVTLRRNNNKVAYCGDFYGQSSAGTPFHDSIKISRLINIINSIKEGITELACHPGLYDDIKTMYNIEREIEVNTLCDIRIKETIKSANIELCSFEGIPY